MNRRNFLGCALTVPLVPFVASAATEKLPVIYGTFNGRKVYDQRNQEFYSSTRPFTIDTRSDAAEIIKSMSVATAEAEARVIASLRRARFSL